MKYVGYFLLTVLIFGVISLIGCGLGWFSSGVQLVQHELDPQVIQQKYEWFKDATAQLDARQATIAVNTKKLAHCDDQKLDRTAREQCMVWEQENTGIIAAFNELAAEYNAQMSKWNYRFANRGQLPQGVTEVLPREYRPYNYGN